MSEHTGAKWQRPDTGAIVEVLPGLGMDCWIVGTVSPSGGRHRIKSRNLPPCSTAEEAQRNLDAYASRKRWEPIVTSAPAGQEPDGDPGDAVSERDFLHRLYALKQDAPRVAWSTDVGRVNALRLLLMIANALTRL